jgi:hypothetical protein
MIVFAVRDAMRSPRSLYNKKWQLDKETRQPRNASRDEPVSNREVGYCESCFVTALLPCNDCAHFHPFIFPYRP